MKQEASKTTGIARTITVLAVFSLVTACHKQVAAVHPPPPPPPAPPAATTPRQPAAVSPVAQNQRPAMPNAATKARIQDLLNRLQDVYFDYDKHNLRSDAQAALEADAKTLTEILQQYPAYKLTVEGFCDERGSEEYNLALGDERAKKAEAFLVTLGLPVDQLRTVSYGKDRPACAEQTESCWQRNRRAHITQEQPTS